MQLREFATIALCSFSALTVLACEDVPITQPRTPEPARSIDAVAEDPCPTCEGIFLTRAAADWSQCYVSSSNDQDGDHLHDNCEWLVAEAFAPQLIISPQDGCYTHEPYFAARPVGTRLIEVMYMIGYHYDCGTLGHPGDSEWVSERISFNQETGRWEFIGYTLSAHWGTANNQTATYYNYEVWYPVQPGVTTRNWGQAKKYPEVWVSRGKHANYRDQGECEYFFSGDTCSDNVPSMRIYVDPFRNIGSYNVRLHDCVTSGQGYVGIECFWTGTQFRGWSNGSGDTPYRDILDSYGWF